jgi:hypothetical protein
MLLLCILFLSVFHLVFDGVEGILLDMDMDMDSNAEEDNDSNVDNDSNAEEDNDSNGVDILAGNVLLT